MSLGDYLGHKTRGGDGSGRRGVLNNWKKEDMAQLTPQGKVNHLDVLLSAKGGIVALWQHGWPKIVERQDRETGKRSREAWSGDINCLETEEVLRKQYYRDENGNREAKPTRCPMCLLLEYVRYMVETESINWLDQVFNYEGDDSGHAVKLYAGGIYGLFGSRDLSDEDKAEMKERIGLTQRNAWRQNAMARCKYAFNIIDLSDPGKGIQIAIESTALGNAVQELIRAELEGQGEELGDPFVRPYAIRWQYWPDESDIGKKYRALAVRKTEIDRELRQQALEGTPPDMSAILAYPNMKQLRAQLEAACTIKLPWDSIFGPVMKICDRDGNVTLPDDEAPETSAPASEQKPPAPKSEVKLVPCDKCRAMIPVDAEVCPKCGQEYDFDDEAPAEQQKVEADKPAPPLEQAFAGKRGKGGKGAPDAKSRVPF